MTAAPVSLPHPLRSSVGALRAVLDDMAIGGWEGIEETEIRELVTELMRIESRVRAHQVAATRVLDESGLARRSGAASTGALLARDFGGDRAAGDRMARTGHQLKAAPRVEQALADGDVTERQATTISAATADVDPEHRDQCQQQLVDDAQRLSLRDLRRRADRITDVYKTPTEVDADENSTLERREARAWANATFRIWNNNDGTHSGDFTIPEAQADLLRTTLESVSAPRREHLHEHSLPDEATTPHQLGRAFAEVCGRLTAQAVMTGGPTAVVRIDLDTLTDVTRAATLSTGTRVSAAEARLTACSAGVLPAVFGGASLPLDLGRERRLFTPAQKLALAERDGGCAFPDCDRPPEWTEAHHWRRPWADGGTTNIDDGVLACACHHRIIHTQHWELRQADDGHIEFRRDDTEPWQRNQRYRG